MRESGEALVAELGITKGMRRSRVGRDGTGALPEGQAGARGAWASISRRSWSRPVTSARGAGLSNIRFFQEGDAGDLEDLDHKALDLVVEHLRRHVRAQARGRG